MSPEVASINGFEQSLNYQVVVMHNSGYVMSKDILTGSLIVFSLVLIAAMSPGPDLLIVLRNALGAGRQSGLYTAMGIAVAIYIHVAYSMLGIALIISQSIILFNIVKYAGAAYLVWLAYKAFKSKGWNVHAEHAQNPEKTFIQSFSQGFITNALNPKATLFFLALFTQIMEPSTPLLIQFWYGSICAMTALCWFSIVAVCLTHAPIRARLAAASIWIDRLTGIAFIALAARISLSKIN